MSAASRISSIGAPIHLASIPAVPCTLWHNPVARTDPKSPIAGMPIIDVDKARTVVVIKRSGERVTYDRSKAILGVTKACEKRPVSLEQIEIIVDRVERDLARSGRREVPSESIGRYVLEQLRDVDEVAYVRFASVYRSFQNIDEFFALLNDLIAEDENK